MSRMCNWLQNQNKVFITKNKWPNNENVLSFLIVDGNNQTDFISILPVNNNKKIIFQIENKSLI